MRNLVALLLVLAASREAAAFGVVLVSDTSKTRIAMADLPGSEGMILVAWEGLPGPNPAGAMVYTRDQGAGETTYFAVGGGGLFAIVDAGERTLVGGTVVPVYRLVHDDPKHPAKLKLELGGKLDVAAMTAKYAAFEHVAAAGETRPAIEAAVTAAATRTNKTCGGRIAPQIRWADFDKAGKLPLAKQTIAILEAIESICADQDYRAALRATTTLRVALAPDAGALQLAASGATLAVTFSAASFNPRETARVWLEKNL